MQDSLKRKLLAGGIAGALVLGAGAVAGAATGAGPFDNGTPEVGQHNGTEVEHGTEVGNETTTTSLGTDPSVAPPAPDVAPGHDGPDQEVGDDNGVDAPGHDATDDNGVDAPGHDATDDNGVDAPGHDATDGPGHDAGHDNSGPGSDSSGHGDG